MSDTGTVKMPRYTSHKTVSALEITKVTTEEGGMTALLDVAETGFGPVQVDTSLFARYTPQPGDFFVVYADGYQSVSPRKAFLDGYTLEAELFDRPPSKLPA